MKKLMKKLILIFLLTACCSYGQVFTDTTEVWLGSKKIQGSDLIYNTSGATLRIWDIDSINKAQEKQFLNAQKHDLSVILGEYLKIKSKKIVGYTFIELENISKNATSSIGRSVYFESEKQYAPPNETVWIYNEFEDRLKAIEYLKDVKQANAIIHNLRIDKIIRVEPIYVDKEKTLGGFYEWLSKQLK